MYLEETLENSEIVKKGSYNYAVNGICDGIPFIDQQTLDEVVFDMEEIVEHFNNIDKLVTIEAMGIPITTGLCLRMGIPMSIIRKKQYNFDDEVSMRQTTGYSVNTLYINKLKKDERIVIIDSLLSTGGTLNCVLDGLSLIGVKVLGIVVAVCKELDVLKELSFKYSVPIYTLTTVNVTENNVEVGKGFTCQK